jgi:hypothetical protein
MDNNEVPTPNVSYCIEENEVHYDGGDTIITVNLNVISNTTNDFIYQFIDIENCESIRYDGETLDISQATTNFTAGEHVIEYVFPHTVVCPSIYGGSYMSMDIKSVIIPEGIRRIERRPCESDDGLCPSIGEIYGGTLSIPTTLEYVGVDAICDDVSISQDDMARLDSCCPLPPIAEGHHPWRASCGK